MALTVTDLSVAYRQRPVLNHLSLSPIAAGSLVAVIGPNAVGKSTLLKTITGLLPYRGDVHLGEQDLRRLSPAERFRALGYLPQTLPQATTLVAYETVFSACRAVRHDLSASQVEAALETAFTTLGIEALAFRKLSEMSGGQRQMVGLAQVLVRQPRLLLLDEPTSALDLHWQLNVLETVRKATADSGAIALVASHDINLALRFCDELLVLGPAGLLAQGSPADVLTPALLRATYGIEGRVEYCSRGSPMVLTDRAVSPH
ncbi:ABC transporter ATP-binding protein [Allohahella marinimesophila]|uniref:ABC transporter ATP-binding protein n=1 Tax=Allohahella marinimesophila TaxID=1054972 RepID=A0ABP7NY38_9GAMM